MNDVCPYYHLGASDSEGIIALYTYIIVQLLLKLILFTAVFATELI